MCVQIYAGVFLIIILDFIPPSLTYVPLYVS